jgi:hypothetical protein
MHKCAKSRERGGRNLTIDLAVVSDQDLEARKLQYRLRSRALSRADERAALDDPAEEIFHVGAQQRPGQNGIRKTVRDKLIDLRIAKIYDRENDRLALRPATERQRAQPFGIRAD